MSEPYLGQIEIFAGNFAPRGYARCSGQILPINQNQSLFSILGTTYGGDGRTSFGLPNLNGRTPIQPRQGPGLDNFSLGQRVGTANHTLTAANLPSHAHTIGEVTLPTSDTAATLKSPTGNYPAQPAEFAYGDATDATASITAPTETGSQGGGQPVENRSPSLELTFIIATTGLFPSQN